MTITAPFAMSTFTRVNGFLESEGPVHLRGSREWGVGPACTDEVFTGVMSSVLVNQITCEACLDSLPGVWEVQVPDKRLKTGRRTLYTGFSHEDGALAVAMQTGRDDAEAVQVTMRELIEQEKETR